MAAPDDVQSAPAHDSAAASRPGAADGDDQAGAADGAGEGGREDTAAPGGTDSGPAPKPSRRERRAARWEQIRQLIVAIRDGDEDMVETAVVQLSQARRWLAPLAFLVGAFAMLFNGVKLLVTNWRLTLIQLLPAMWIWAALIDLKAHVLHGKQFHVIRGPLVLLPFAGVIVLTAAAFYLNAVFGFSISRKGPPDIRGGFTQAREHLRVVLTWGIGVGIPLAVATILAPRWGLFWFALLLGIMIAVMMICYVSVPARIIGVTTSASRRDKLAAAAVGGTVGAIVCTPPYLIGRLGLVLLSGSLFPLGVALLVVGLTLEAGANGAVKTIKMSAKLVGSHTQSTNPEATS